MKDEHKYILLDDALIIFLSVLLECLNKTTYSVDRPVYMQDIAIAASWIVEFSQKKDLHSITEKITSSSTNKLFGDYFRQGDLGIKEADALKELQNYAKQFCKNESMRQPIALNAQTPIA
jgi:hypothetical protein